MGNNTTYSIHCNYRMAATLYNLLYIHVTVRRYRFLFKNQPGAIFIQIYSVIKFYMFRAKFLPIIRSVLLTFGTAKFHAALSRPLPSRARMELTLFRSGHQKPARNLPVPIVQYNTPDDGQRSYPKHAEFYNIINLDK